MDNYQLDTVREIALLKSLMETSNLVSNLTTEQEEMLTQIVSTDWPRVRFKVGHVLPNRGDILNSQIEKRREIRHTVRLMLGLDPVSEYEIQMAELDGSYGAVIGGMGGGGGSGGSGGSAGVGEFGVFTVSGNGNRGGVSDSGEL